MGWGLRLRKTSSLVPSPFCVVSAFWKDKKFKTAVLMGSFNEKLTDLYKINGIPTTVIIGKDGSIVDQHSGFGGGEAMIKGLKEKVQAALAD